MKLSKIWQWVRFLRKNPNLFQIIEFELNDSSKYQQRNPTLMICKDKIDEGNISKNINSITESIRKHYHEWLKEGRIDCGKPI